MDAGAGYASCSHESQLKPQLAAAQAPPTSSARTSATTATAARDVCLWNIERVADSREVRDVSDNTRDKGALDDQHIDVTALLQHEDVDADIVWSRLVRK